MKALADDEAVVPTIWARELTNALLVGVRRGRLSEEEASSAHLRLLSLPVVVEPMTRKETFEDTTRIARRHGLSAYDAAYVELARRRRIPLATLDGSMKAAARAEGVEVIP